MNKVYKVIFCKSTQTFVAVSEFAKGQGKSNARTVNKSRMGNFTKTAMAMAMLFAGQQAFAVNVEGENIIATGKVLVGSGNTAGTGGVAVGSGNVVGLRGLAVGQNNKIKNNKYKGKNGVALGEGNTVAEWSQAMGYETEALAQVSTAIGTWAKATGHGSISMGHKTLSYGSSSIAMGGVHHAKVVVRDGKRVAVPSNGHMEKGGQALSIGSLAIGSGTIAGTKGDGTTDDQFKDLIGGAERAVALGYDSMATGDRAIVLGFGEEYTNDGSKSSQATGDKSGAVGTTNRVLNSETYAFGNDNTVKGSEDAREVKKSMALGFGNTISTENTFVLGSGVTQTVDNSVALGNESAMTAGAAIGTKNVDTVGAEGETTTAGNTGKVDIATVGSVTYEGFAGHTANGVVSVGSAGKERRVQNVAAGEISKTSTDAINGSQLNAIAISPITFTADENADTDAEQLNKQYAAKDGTQRQLGQAFAIETGDAKTGFVGDNLHTKVENGKVIIGMTETPVFDSIQFGDVNGPKIGKNDDGSITVGDKDGNPINITGVKSNLPETVNGDSPTTGQNVPDFTGDKAKNLKNVATVEDILNAGWNLQNNNTQKDFVKAYDKVNFNNGNGTVARVEVDEKGKRSNIFYDVATDDVTIELIGTANGKPVVKVGDEWFPADPATGKPKEGEPALTPDEMKTIADTKVKAKTGEFKEDTNKAGLVASKTGDEKKVATVKNVADAINNSGFKLDIAGNIGTDDTTENGYELINPSDTVTIKAGDHLKVSQKQGVITLETNNDAILNDAIAGDNVTTVVTAKLDGKDVVKNDAGDWVEVDPATGEPTTTKVPVDKIKDIAGTQVKAKTAKVEVDPNTGKTKELSDADKKAVATAGDVQKAINDASHKITATNSDVVANTTGGTKVMKAGEELTLEAGKNLNIQKDADKFILSTKKEVKFDNVQVGDVVINKDAGINAGNKKITNVESGLGTTPLTEATGDTLKNAVNVGDLKKATASAKEDVKSADQSVTVVTTQATDGSNIFDLSVKVDADTMAFVDDGNGGKKLKPKTAELPLTDGKVDDLSDEDKKKLATAGDIANAINNSGFTITSGQVGGGQNTGKSDKFVNAGETIELIAGDHMTIEQEGGKFTFKTNNEAIVTGGIAGDNETTVVTAKLDGKDVIKNDNGEWVEADNDGKPTDKKVDADKVKDIASTQVKAKTAKVEVDPNTGKTKELSDVDKKAVATAGDVQKAINDASHKILADNSDVVAKAQKGEKVLKAGEKLTFEAGKNLNVQAEGDKFILSTEMDVEFDTITAKKGITLGEGNTAINITPSMTKALNKDGKPNDAVLAVDMSGSTFTGVASNLPETINKAGNKGTIAQEAPENIEGSNVATVDDLLNAGFNLQNNGAAKDFVKPYDTVNFVDGLGTTARVTVTDNKVSDIAYDIKLNKDTMTLDQRGNVSVNTTPLKTTNGTVDKPANPKSIATAGDVADAINGSYHTIKVTNSTESVKAQDGAKQVKAGDTLIVEGGKNINASMKDGKLVLSTTSDVNFNNVVVSKEATVNMGGNQVHNVAAGSKPTDAVNFDQLKTLDNKLTNVIGDVSDENKAGIAGSSAIAMLGHARDSGQSAVSAGVAFHEGEGALAVGVSAWSDNGHWLIKGAAAIDTQSKTTVGASATYNWD